MRVAGIKRSCGPVAPLPVRFTDCCEPKGSLSVMVSVPEKNPALGGVKVTLIVHVACGAKGAVQVFAETAKLVLATTLEMASALCPEFNSVVVSGGAATPIAELPKLSAV